VWINRAAGLVGTGGAKAAGMGVFVPKWGGHCWARGWVAGCYCGCNRPGPAAAYAVAAADTVAAARTAVSVTCYKQTIGYTRD